MIPLDQVAFGELGKRGLDNEDAGPLDSISISYFWYWEVFLKTSTFLSVGMWLSFQVDSVDEAYLSFCQFQGFWFWFQHQGEGEEDEEEEACGENHHDVGVPWSLLSTGTRVKNTHTKYMHCLRFTPQNNEEIFPIWTFSWIGDKVRSFPNLFLSIQKKRHRDKLFQCNQSYYLWLSCFTACNLLLFASLSFSLILFKDSQDDTKETQ